jgi:hypothetical protein
MISKWATIDEIDGTSRLLVEVPVPGSDRFAYLLRALLSAGTVPALAGVVLTVGPKEGLLWPLPAVMMGIMLLISLLAFRHCLVLASRPDFAVGKDGLQLREGPTQNHYDWEEVRYCHWSHYEPGVLNIQVGAHLAWPGVTLPPTRLFHHIPEAYQAQVEKAIRNMRKWAAGESESALVQTVSWGNDSSGLMPAIFDEFDTTQLALIEIPYSRRKLVVSFLPALLWICWGATMCGPEGAPMAHLWLGPLFFGGMVVVVAVSALSRTSRPEFAVFKEGIWLPLNRSLKWASPWNPNARGLFAWDEVSYCRWSRYAPGVLMIQVAGTRSLNRIAQPPTRLEYRVPEEYLPSVETSIRAMGKWAD